MYAGKVHDYKHFKSRRNKNVTNTCTSIFFSKLFYLETKFLENANVKLSNTNICGFEFSDF